MNTTGSVTKTTFLYGPEEYKMASEFIVGVAVKAGQLVKLVAATGKITPLLVTDEENLCIGMAIKDGAADELVVVSTRGYAIINGISAGALDAGPVKQNAYDSTNLANEYVAAATAVLTHGWNLDPADGADETIRILIKN